MARLNATSAPALEMMSIGAEGILWVDELLAETNRHLESLLKVLEPSSHRRNELFAELKVSENMNAEINHRRRLSAHIQFIYDR